MKEIEEVVHNHDDRTLKVLSKYFAFFHIKKWLPKKWKHHIIEHIDTFFSDRDIITDKFEKKDSTLNSLSINDITDILESMADEWNVTADSLKLACATQETDRVMFNKQVDFLSNSLQEIIDAQNN